MKGCLLVFVVIFFISENKRKKKKKDRENKKKKKKELQAAVLVGLRKILRVFIGVRDCLTILSNVSRLTSQARFRSRLPRSSDLRFLKKLRKNTSYYSRRHIVRKNRAQKL